MFEILETKEGRISKDGSLWYLALGDVQSHILAEFRKKTFTRSQKQALWRIYDFCRGKIEDGPPAAAETNRELAVKYGVSLRTVTNWRRQGCPFHEGQVKVLDWLFHRRYVPAGTREKFSRQLAKRSSFRFAYRGFKTALDQVRQMKRDYLTHGLEMPAWLKSIRATRRTKGMVIGRKAKGKRNTGKGRKTRSDGAYFVKFMVEASKVVCAIDSEPEP